MRKQVTSPRLSLLIVWPFFLSPVSAARVVCGSQPVASTISASVAPSVRSSSAITLAILLVARGATVTASQEDLSGGGECDEVSAGLVDHCYSRRDVGRIPEKRKSQGRVFILHDPARLEVEAGDEVRHVVGGLVRHGADTCSPLKGRRDAAFAMAG